MDKRISIFALTALFSTGAFAVDSPVTFSELDTDDDGVITQDEAKGSKLEQHFQKADQDGDSNISEAEYDLYKEMKELKASGSQSGGGQSGGGGGQSGGQQGGGG